MGRQRRRRRHVSLDQALLQFLYGAYFWRSLEGRRERLGGVNFVPGSILDEWTLVKQQILANGCGFTILWRRRVRPNGTATEVEWRGTQDQFLKTVN